MAAAWILEQRQAVAKIEVEKVELQQRRALARASRASKASSVRSELGLGEALVSGRTVRQEIAARERHAQPWGTWTSVVLRLQFPES